MGVPEIRIKLPKRKRVWHYRQRRPEIGSPNEIWAMDFSPTVSSTDVRSGS